MPAAIPSTANKNLGRAVASVPRRRGRNYICWCKDVRRPRHSTAAEREVEADGDARVVGQVRCGDGAAVEVRDQPHDVQAEAEMRLAVDAAATGDERFEQAVVEERRQE